MKYWLGSILPAIAVGIGFMLVPSIDGSGWRFLALFGCYVFLQVCYVQRFPRAAALRYALKLKPGQKIEVESK